MNSNKKPLVTFVLFAYNQEKFIREAVAAALAQDYENLEIILSDDCSADLTFEIIEEVVDHYEGPHKIRTNKNPVNAGLTSHFNKLVSESRGEIIVVAAGDDISCPDRVTNTVKLLESDPSATFVSFNDIIIDSNGREIYKSRTGGLFDVKKTTLMEYISGKPMDLSGASRGYRKRIFSDFGLLNERCPTEDTPCLIRGLLCGHGLVSSRPGIKYRKHQNNLSGANLLNRMNFIEIKDQYLRDLDKAREINLISNSDYKLVVKWVDRNYRRRVAQKKLHDSNYALSVILGFMFTSGDFSLREKLGVVKGMIYLKLKSFRV